MKRRPNGSSATPPSPGKRGLVAIALGLGAAGVLATLALDYLAFQNSRDAVAQTIYRTHLGIAKVLAAQAVSGEVEDELLARLDRRWVALDPPFKKCFLCVIGRDGRLLHHTLNPAMVGTYVGDNGIPAGPGQPSTVSALVGAKADWAGRNRSFRGVDQLAAYAYSPELDALVALHVPTAVVDEEIRHAQRPWVVAMGFTAALLPASLGLLLLVVIRTRRALLGAYGDLLRTRADLERAQRISQVGNWRYQVSCGTIEWSDELYRIFGLDPSTPVTYQRLIERVHPDDRAEHDRYTDRLRSARPGAPIAPLDYRLVRPGGEERHVHVEVEVEFDAGGAAKTLFGTVQDTTGREEDRRALFESENLFRSAFEDAAIPMAVQDPGGIYLRVNRPLCQLLGRRPEELLGMSYHEVTHPDDRAADERLDEDLLGGPAGYLGGIEKRYRRQDGREVTAMVSASIVRDAEGNALYRVVQVQDITERKATEELRRRQNEALAEIAQGIPLEAALQLLIQFVESQGEGVIASILLMDPDGVHLRHGAAPGLDAAYVRAVDGVAIGEGVGSCGTAAFRRETVIVEDAETDPLWAPYRGLLRPQGLRACWSAPIIDSAGSVAGTVAIYRRQPGAPSARDRELLAAATHLASLVVGRHRTESKRRRAEERLVENLHQVQALSARLESYQEEERKRISREIHDELGQTMTALKIDLRNLEEEIMRLPPSPRRNRLEEDIVESVALVDEAIGFVRAVALRIRPSVLDQLGLPPALRQECEQFEAQNRIPCRFEVSPGFPRLEDELQTGLFRLAQEFLTNVTRHAGASRVEVFLDGGGGSVRMEIRDDGCGFDPAQARGSTHLGLLGAGERVEQMKGALRIESGAGAGTVIEVTIPLGRPAEAAPSGVGSLVGLNG